MCGPKPDLPSLKANPSSASARQREATYNIFSRILGEFVVSASTHKLDTRRDQRDLSLALPLAARRPSSHAVRMFVVSEAGAAAIRAAFERGGELSAAVELRRLFRGITSTAQAREYGRTIAGWEADECAPLRSVALRRSIKRR